MDVGNYHLGNRSGQGHRASTFFTIPIFQNCRVGGQALSTTTNYYALHIYFFMALFASKWQITYLTRAEFTTKTKMKLCV